MTTLWYVRSYFWEAEHEVFVDEGPWERTLAELVIADIGVDASIQRGIGRVTVTRAILVAEGS